MKTGEKEVIYLDHNATTPLDPSAVKAMMPYLEGEFGNPSCSYSLGLRAKAAVDEARNEVALLIGCADHEITFTSGGSESNNAVLKGVIDFKNPGKFHIITSSVEHPAILNPALFLNELGVRVSVLPVDTFGRVDPDEVRKAITHDTTLISIMLANNETGTLQPIEEISRIAKEFGIPIHTDAAQAVGKIRINVNRLGVDFLSIAGHKLYAPKGVGALYMKKGRSLTPLIHGAGQEGGNRAGTENVILSVGLGAASKVARKGLDQNINTMRTLRDRLQELLVAGLTRSVLNGHPVERLPNTLNISVPGIAGAQILEGLPSLLASTGAACHDRSVKLSHVLSAMGVTEEVGMGALRLTTGRENTMIEIETAAQMIIERVRALEKGTQG
jgi:cysteine desulfurase